MSEIKTGDPTVRAFVAQAIEEAERSVKIAGALYSPREAALLEAAVALLKDWQTATTPYTQRHILATATAISGYDFNEFKRSGGI